MITWAVFEWARRTPDKTAIVCDGAAWSYAAFASRIAVARAHFARRGYSGPGLAVVAAPSALFEFWVLSLALRSLGWTTMQAPSIQTIGEPSAGPRLVAAAADRRWPDLADACASAGLPLEIPSLDGDAAPDVSGPLLDGGNILRTSGTTGAPKKVLMHPAFEVAFARERRELLGIDHEAVVASFDYGGWTGVGYNSPVSAWFVGATAVVDQDAPHHRTLAHPGLTHAMVTPALLAQLLGAPHGAYPFRPNLHLSVTSGAMTEAEVDQVRARITPRIFNRVGSTEVNTFANTLLERPEDHRWHRLAPARTVQVVDDLDRPLPVGQIGRLRVSARDGPNGYVDDEEATRTFFRDGFFYPGDLAVMREDGRLALQGRVTDVINIRGVKVMPEPIESRLREALGVAACLMSMQDEIGEEQLHLVLETATAPPAARLRGALQRELHGFAGVHVHLRPTLPRNDRGKLMRGLLTLRLIGERAGGPPPG